MGMPWVIWHLGLFDGTNRADSEDTILWKMEILTDRNCRYLDQHPETPKLYDSHVKYALPDQMSESRLSEEAIGDVERLLRRNRADEETIDGVTSFLRGIEVFRDIPMIIKKGSVDCDNLACWRVSELRQVGVKATPYITWKERNGGTTYHALVRWPDGSTEDPSLLLGMGGEAREMDRAREKLKNKERFRSFVETAKALCGQGGMDPNEAGRQIKSLGLIPIGGQWAA